MRINKSKNRTYRNLRRQKTIESTDLSKGGYIVSINHDVFPVSYHFYANFERPYMTLAVVPMLYNSTKDANVKKACIEFCAAYLKENGNLDTEDMLKDRTYNSVFFREHKGEIESASVTHSLKELNKFVTEAARDTFMMVRYEDLYGEIYLLNFRITSHGVRWNDVIMNILADMVNKNKRIDSVNVDYDDTYGDTGRKTPSDWHGMDFETFLDKSRRMKFESRSKMSRLFHLIDMGNIKIRVRHLRRTMRG